MIIFMGLAGSGKSTQGKLLAEDTGRLWLSTGEMLREISDETALAALNRGKLTPDAVVIPLASQAIAEAFAEGKDVIMDGFPRTAKQAEWLVEHELEKVEMVLRIQVPKSELIQRIKLRGRDDDQSIEAIEERFRLTEQNIYTVCEVLKEHGVRIADVDGRGTVEEVQARVKQAITEVENE